MITIIITEVDGAGVEAHGAVAFPRKFCWRCVRWAYSWRINGCSRWRLLSSTIPSNISSAISSTVPSNLFSAISNTISVLNKKRISSFCLIKYLFIKFFQNQGENMLIFCYYNSKTTIYNRNGIILLLLQIILCYFNRHISKRDVCKG